MTFIYNLLVDSRFLTKTFFFKVKYLVLHHSTALQQALTILFSI